MHFYSYYFIYFSFFRNKIYMKRHQEVFEKEN